MKIFIKIARKGALFVIVLYSISLLIFLYSEKTISVLVCVLLAVLFSIDILVGEKMMGKYIKNYIQELDGKNTIIEKKKKYYYGWLILIAIFFGLTLPFHYVPSKLMMFPKENLTFSYTIITQDDIDALIKRYNECLINNNVFQTLPIRNEPLFRKLMEHGLIMEKK